MASSSSKPRVLLYGWGDPSLSVAAALRALLSPEDLILAYPTMGPRAAARFLIQQQFPGWHKAPALERLPAAYLLDLASSSNASVLLLVGLLNDDPQDQQLLPHFQALHSMLHLNLAATNSPLRLHVFLEANLFRRSPSSRIDLIRDWVPVGPLFASTCSSAGVSWIARSRLYVTSWSLSDSVPLTSAGHLPLRTADGQPPEQMGFMPSIPTGQPRALLPPLHLLPSVAAGRSVSLACPSSEQGWPGPPSRFAALPLLPPLATPSKPTSLAASSTDARRRWQASDQILPPSAFESYNLLRDSSSAVTLSKEDWLSLLGLPTGWLDLLRDHHFAYISAATPQSLLLLLFRPLTSQLVPIPLPVGGGVGERLGRLRPVFERHSHLFVPPHHHSNLFSSFLKAKKLNPASFSPPSYPELDARGEAWAAVGAQRGASTSRWAPPPTVSAASKSEHISKALLLPHPFQRPPLLEADLSFAISLTTSAAGRPARQEFLDLVARLSSSLKAFDREAISLMPPSVRRVHGGHSPGLLLFWVLLLGWPDFNLVLQEIDGYPVIGHIPPSNLYPSVVPQDSVPLKTLLETADKWNRSLETSLGPAEDPATDWELLRQTREDRSLKACWGPFSLDQLNDKWGAGCWRAIARRGLWQEHNGKLRAIDNARSSLHNDATEEQERLRVIGGDIVPSVARRFMTVLRDPSEPTLAAASSGLLKQRAAGRTTSSSGSIVLEKQHSTSSSSSSGTRRALPQLLGSSEDWSRGYRQRACRTSSLPFNVVAFYHIGLKRVLFWVYAGLLFGLASSVISFNRTPALLVAVLRRVAGVPAFHYFDDLGLLDPDTLASLGTTALRLIHSSAGFNLDEGKASAGADWVFLGVLYLLKDAFKTGFLVADAKPGRRAGILSSVNLILRTKLVSLEGIQKLRGKAGHLASTNFGRMGRAPEQAMVAFEASLKATHRRAEEPIDKDLEQALLLLKALLLRAPPRKLYLEVRYKAPTLIYSDASFEPQQKVPARVGLVVFSERLRKPVGLTAVVSQENLAALRVRKQQITQVETMASALILEHLPQVLENVDAIWFIDNSGGEAGLISGYSSSEDSACMLGVVHITLAALNCRVWWEHVPSEVNPSDGLSRGGLLDDWTRRQDWDIREVSLPDWSNLKDLPLDTLLGKFAEVTARLPEANVEQAPVEWKIPQVPPSELERLLGEDGLSLGKPVEFTV